MPAALVTSSGHRLARNVPGPASTSTRVASPSPGSSDGATYALALGRANGDRFTHRLAFSPGFLIPIHRQGVPSIFVSHGRADTVLPIATCSRRLVPALRRRGYVVRYREFDGGHEVPPDVAADPTDGLLGRS
jgi:predicted esterase